MRAVRSFTVRTQLPPALARLQTLALNLRWAWDDRTRRLFRWVDAEAWEQVGHDPVRLLAAVSSERLQALAAEPSFMAFLDEIHDDLTRYLESPAWLQLRGETPLRAVAYFSPEFGINESLPQYSGGLGILAGDHLKAASDENLPLLGMGLFYREGFFQQSVVEGHQTERYQQQDPVMLGATDTGIIVDAPLGSVTAQAKIWRIDVGRIPLYLLDTDLESNTAAVRSITDRLYSGDQEHRLRSAGRNERAIVARLVEDHRTHPAQVVERGDRGVHDGNRDERDEPPLPGLDRSVEDVDLRDEPGRRGQPRQRHEAQ